MKYCSKSFKFVLILVQSVNDSSASSSFNPLSPSTIVKMQNLHTGIHTLSYGTTGWENFLKIMVISILVVISLILST